MRGARGIPSVALVAVLAMAGCGKVEAPGHARAPSASLTPSTLGPTAPTGTPSPHPTAKPAPTHRASPPSTPSPTVPPSSLPTSLAGQVIDRLPTSRSVVALTFDAGANGDGVPTILSALAASGVPATFFVTGNFVTHYPSLTHRIAAAGMVIGDHTVSHPHLRSQSDAAVRAQVLDAATAISRATGRSPRPWFRFPYGEYDAHRLSVVNGIGYAAIGWTIDTLGWKGTSGGQSVTTILARIRTRVVPGAIVLMHVGSNPQDGSTLDANALTDVIDHLRATGYGFTTLTSLLS